MKRAFRILLLDDDAAFLNALARQLEQLGGLQIFTALTADEGAELLPHVDAVLADCVFPDAQLFEEAVRKSGKPIIRMSGKVGRAMNLELHKPFSPRELLNTVELLRFLHSPQLKATKAA